MPTWEPENIFFITAWFYARYLPDYPEQVINLLTEKFTTTLEEAKDLIGQWRKEYNQLRPHSALGYRPPAPETILTKVTR